jgi:predicted CXXCH cytochrome family protein
LAIALLAGLAVPAAVAQENDDCLMCHEEDPIEPASYLASIHGDLDCIFCHQDLMGAELPHDEGLQPVDCSMCHGEAAEIEARSLHGQAAQRGDPMAPTCADCHGTHDIRAVGDPEARTAVTRIPLMCGSCHREGSPVSRQHDIDQERILENYSMSIHGEGLFRQGLTVTAVCTSCHTAHTILPHENPESSIHRDNIARTCEQCHGEIERVHRAFIEGRLWREAPDKIPVCVDCHSPHEIRNVLYPAGSANRDCLRCHGDESLTMERDGRQISLYVAEGPYVAGEHGETACAQCHSDVTASRERPCETVQSAVDCAVCHAEVVAVYESSTHGTLHAAGDPDAPFCGDCHAKHATLPKELPASPTFARNVPDLCAGCHRQGEQAAVRIHSEIPDIVQGYEDSIHGKGLVDSGLLVTATCANCHTAHGELPPDDPASTVHRSNIAHTCGGCHHGIEETFLTSIHWPANSETERKLPTCQDCHSSHTIQRTGGDDVRMVMMDQCGSCHEAETETFFDTFHGKVSRLGAAATAKCHDCHGTHDILPASDPASTLSRGRVVETCGSCHEGSHRRFAGYLTHATHHDSDRYPWLFWSFWGMTALLIGTLSFALLHTFAWLVRLWVSRDEWREHRALAKANGEAKLYRRFNRLQRTLHVLMIVSFFTLALTGMALKFSYMGWAHAVSWLLGGFESMGLLHRMGAITLFVIVLVHLGDVLRRKWRLQQSWREVLTGPNSLLFSLQDLREAKQSILWFFGKGPRPSYGRYTYWEKFDYFAVFWGVFIIGSTGLLLWFPELFTRVIPGWFVNVATIIHSDEALLAVAFIFTIHFFNTHFRPDKFPMDPVIFTGRVTLDELKYDKPREYEQLMASEERDRYLVDPFPRGAERAFKIFGFIALAIGLTLIALIVFTMLFGYR